MWIVLQQVLNTNYEIIQHKTQTLLTVKSPRSHIVHILKKHQVSLTLLQTQAIVRRCSVKMVFLEISQNSQESTCARDSFLIKLQALGKISKGTFFYRTPPVVASVQKQVPSCLSKLLSFLTKFFLFCFDWLSWIQFWFFLFRSSLIFVSFDFLLFVLL